MHTDPGRKHTLQKTAIAAVTTALLATAGLLLYHFYPIIQAWMQPERMEALRQDLQRFGIGGAFALAAVQALQVISGIIPALPIQIAAGLTYGALPGLAICLGGIAAGSSAVFVLVKKYGEPVVNRIFPPEKQAKLAFLNDARRLELIVFLLYLIPAMPKDVFTYLAALTPLTWRRYLPLTLLARAPTILCSTFASGALMEGNYVQAALIFCVTAVLGLLCMLCSKRIMTFLKKHR